MRVKAWGVKGAIGSQEVPRGRCAHCCMAQGKSCPVGFSLLSGKGEASSGCSRKPVHSGCLLVCKLKAGWLGFRDGSLSVSEQALRGQPRCGCRWHTYNGLNCGPATGRAEQDERHRQEAGWSCRRKGLVSGRPYLNICGRKARRQVSG